VDLLKPKFFVLSSEVSLIQGSLKREVQFLLIISKFAPSKAIGEVPLFMLPVGGTEATQRTCICEACRSIVMMWSAPATDNMLATSLADIGARL